PVSWALPKSRDRPPRQWSANMNRPYDHLLLGIPAKPLLRNMGLIPVIPHVSYRNYCHDMNRHRRRPSLRDGRTIVGPLCSMFWPATPTENNIRTYIITHWAPLSDKGI